VLEVATGGAISGGIAYTTINGAPVAGITGTGGAINLTSTKAMRLDGAIVASSALTVAAGSGTRADASYGAVDQLSIHPAYGIFNQASYFQQLAVTAPTHYLANYTGGYGLLVTGTLSVLAANSTLDLHAEKPLIIRANITMPGTNSQITLRSAGLLFVEGYLTATAAITMKGGYQANGTVASTTGADANDKSVAFGPSSRLWTTEAGSSIAVSDGQLFIRTTDKLWCIGK
jgi:hypothetical protein